MQSLHSRVFFISTGFFLSMIAGLSNGVSLVGFAGESVSYVTGNLASMSLFFLEGRDPEAWHLLRLVLFFWAGAAVSGFATGGADPGSGNRYGILLMVQGGLLSASIPLLYSGSMFGEFLVSTACGMQNGMVTTISGTIVRTTHMTGIVTDLGIAAGTWIRRGRGDFWRSVLHLSLLLGFLAGGIGGVILYSRIYYGTLWIGGGLSLGGGVGFFLFRKYFSRLL